MKVLILDGGWCHGMRSLAPTTVAWISSTCPPSLSLLPSRKPHPLVTPKSSTTLPCVLTLTPTPTLPLTLPLALTLTLTLALALRHEFPWLFSP